MKTNGPGKYDDEATFVRERTGADGVIVMVVGGNRGGGFAVQGPELFVRSLPAILERIARDIREQNDLGPEVAP